MSTINSTVRQHTLANLTISERKFLEYFYVQVYVPPSLSEGRTSRNLWDPSTSPTFSRQLIRSICIQYGYGGTIHWIVRKQFGRRQLDRGLYIIPEIVELHELWCNTENLNLTITSHRNDTIVINRRFNS